MSYKVWTSGAHSNCSVGADQPPSLTYSGARLRPSSISTSHTSPRIFRTRCPGETRDPGDTRGSSYAVGRERSRVITSYSSPHAENHAPPTHQNGLRFTRLLMRPYTTLGDGSTFGTRELTAPALLSMICKNGLMMSMGIGKIVVEFCSAPISVRVCK
jgi:hypothetical protein